MRSPLPFLAGAVLAASAGAQQPAFTTPGMPASQALPPPAPPDPGSGQTDRFDAVFNPAFSFVVDAVADDLEVEGDAAEEGVGLELRILEFGAQAWVDPDAWAYFVAATDGESVAVEEAAIQYTGLGERASLRAGRFFVDFGKQMQTHVHELRTLERPLVLRTYLGEEVKGDGLQYDGWTPVGDTTAMRWSLAAFASLIPESELEDGEPEIDVADRKDAGDLNFTARLTAFTDVGTNGVLQAGASGRFIPDATAELNGGELGGLDSSVYGLDVTYAWTSDDALRVLTAGGEALWNTGDTALLVDDGGTPDDAADDALVGADDGAQFGWYAFVDWTWSREHSAGVQYGAADFGPDEDASEAEVYYTRRFSELHRLRFAVVAHETDADGGDSVRFAVQYTAAVGAHGHGLSW